MQYGKGRGAAQHQGGAAYGVECGGAETVADTEEFVAPVESQVDDGSNRIVRSVD